MPATKYEEGFSEKEKISMRSFINSIEFLASIFFTESVRHNFLLTKLIATR